MCGACGSLGRLASNGRMSHLLIIERTRLPVEGHRTLTRNRSNLRSRSSYADKAAQPVNGFLQVGLFLVALSLVVMAVLSVVVYRGGGRRTDRPPARLTFDEAPVHSFFADSSPPAMDEQARAGKADAAITRPVSLQSGALNRLLAGVRLPCGLERLHPDGEDEDLRWAFFTIGHEPKIVAMSVAGELERLGLEVEPLSYTEARALQDGLELSVTIFLEPRRVVRNRRVAFPTAPAAAVVVEFAVVWCQGTFLR